MNFSVVGYLDTFDLAASLKRHMGLFEKGEPMRLSVRGPRTNADDPDDESGYGIYKEAGKTRWPELHATLGRIARMGEQVGRIEFGRVWLELLQPGTLLPWEPPGDSAYNTRFSRLMLALRSNPMAPVYSGHESLILAPGFLTMVNHRVAASAINLGETSAIRLICDVKRKADA